MGRTHADEKVCLSDCVCVKVISLVTDSIGQKIMYNTSNREKSWVDHKDKYRESGQQDDTKIEAGWNDANLSHKWKKSDGSLLHVKFTGIIDSFSFA